MQKKQASEQPSLQQISDQILSMPPEFQIMASSYVSALKDIAACQKNKGEKNQQQADQ